MRASYLKILILVLFTSCSLIDDSGDDKNWFWYFTIENSEGIDIFVNNNFYNRDKILIEKRLEESDDPFYSDLEYDRVKDSESIVFRHKLNTANSLSRTYFFDYQNGDIDTLTVEVESDGGNILWRNDELIGIEKIYFIFNDSLHYTFDIKDNPGLDKEIINYSPGPSPGDILTITNDRFLLRFRKRSVVTEK